MKKVSVSKTTILIASAICIAFGVNACDSETTITLPNIHGNCQQECSGDPTCLDDATLKTCQINEETGCAEWIKSPCPKGESCQNGACELQTEPPKCTKECPKAPLCIDESTLKSCHFNEETGCAEWTESSCTEGESCMNGKCEPQTTPPECQKECTEEPACINETTLKTCQINAETGCAEPIELPCLEGESCMGGECKSASTECGTSCPKEALCVNESTLKSCHFNTETGCAEWVETHCPEGESCQNGACEPQTTPPECQKECTEAHACLNESTLKTCQLNAETGCAEWIESPCPKGESCQNGACEAKPPVCTNTCSAPKCADERTYQKCEDTNGDGCKEFSASIACADKQICHEGACIPDDNIYLKDLKPIMQPFWNNKQMLEETAMFINVGDTVQMLYNVDNVVKMTSYDGSKTYTGGVDYTVVGGKLQTLNNAIPHITDANYYNVDEQMLVTSHNGQHVFTYWGEGTTMTQWQVKVTYNHSDAWNGFKQPSYSATFSKLIQKLKNKEDIKIIFYGDSITFGANASYVVGGGTQHSYAMLFTEALADLYGYKVEYQASGLSGTFTNMPSTYNPGNVPKITYINNAVGGWTMENGQNNFEQYITPYAQNCDLFILAFGMNDLNTPLVALNQMAYNMMARMVQISPNVSEVVLSTMVPNPNALNGWNGLQEQQEAAFADGVIKSIQAAGIPIALCQMTTMSKSILTRKEFKDYTGNNINHPNDFFSRVYAQTLLQTVIGYENMK